MTDLIVIRIRRNMLRPTLRPSAEREFRSESIKGDAPLVQRGSNTDFADLSLGTIIQVHYRVALCVAERV